MLEKQWYLVSTSTTLLFRLRIFLRPVAFFASMSAFSLLVGVDCCFSKVALFLYVNNDVGEGGGH